jgi:hypothetical protein
MGRIVLLHCQSTGTVQRRAADWGAVEGLTSALVPGKLKVCTRTVGCSDAYDHVDTREQAHQKDHSHAVLHLHIIPRIVAPTEFSRTAEESNA